MADARAKFRKHAENLILSQDGLKLMTKREYVFHDPKQRNRMKFASTSASNSHVLMSHHYRFNRIREGDWGTKPPTPGHAKALPAVFRKSIEQNRKANEDLPDMK